ncbi:MAG: serine/threonine-protein phosphatase [Bacteroidales bacterium]|nr:serine/threonine-protein phosphatase [Candidatus Sodaliphilus limicaballi]
MRITLKQPIGFSHIGRKMRQEDAVWPAFEDVTPQNRCIVLCDGVGGSEHGEIASQISSKVIGEYLSGVIAQNDYITDNDVQDAVNLAYDKLEGIDINNADSGKVSMATTLTCVCFHKGGVLAAHMGDSRIYHVRPGHGILYQSNDHSLVNALIKAGELKPEEVKNFPRKNVITKAIQPHTDRRLTAECRLLTDINAGDYLFICCDGVLEQLSNNRLVEVLSMSCLDEEKLQKLEAESLDKTRDNFTAYLIPIDSVSIEENIKEDNVENISIKKSFKHTVTSLTGKIILFLACVLLAILIKACG